MRDKIEKALGKASKPKVKKSISQRLVEMNKPEPKVEAVKAVSKPEVKVAVATPVKEASPIEQAIAEPTPAPKADEEAVSTNAYKQALASVLHPAGKAPRKKVETAVIANLANENAGDAGEEDRGFIGKYSSKLSAQE